MFNRIIITYIVSSSSVDTSDAVKPQVKLKFLFTASVSGTLTLLTVSLWQLHIEIRNLRLNPKLYSAINDIFLNLELLVSTYVVCKRLSVMHKQVSG